FVDVTTNRTARDGQAFPAPERDRGAAPPARAMMRPDTGGLREMIIDVDAHGEPPEHVVAEAWEAAELPGYDTAEATMRFVAGDLLSTLPREQWPPLEDLLPPGAAAIAGKERVEGFAYEGAEQHGLANPATRVAWLDAN